MHIWDGKAKEGIHRGKLVGAWSVEEGVSGVEVGGVSDPNEVGDEKVGCGSRDFGEGADREGDENPHEDDHDEGEVDLVSSEEDGAPGEIEDELGKEENSEAVFSQTALMPDEGEADSDENVEAGPDRAEEPIGWGAERAIEGGIPIGNGAGSDEAAKPAEEEHDEGAENDFGGEGLHDEIITGW